MRCRYSQTVAAQLALFGKGAQLLSCDEGSTDAVAAVEAKVVVDGDEKQQQGSELGGDEVVDWVQRHIIKTVGAEAVDLLLRFEVRAILKRLMGYTSMISSSMRRLPSP